MKTFVKFFEGYEKELSHKIKKNGITVTVSGLSGVGKGSISDAIAEKFTLKKITMGDVFRRIAKERNITLEELSANREDKLDYDIEKTALKLAMEGGVVLDGRMTGMVSGNYSDCRIFLECSMDRKCIRVSKREGISPEVAREKLTERDTSDSTKYLKLYGCDGSDKKFYDAIIDTTNITMDESKIEAVKTVRRILKEKKIL